MTSQARERGAIEVGCDRVVSHVQVETAQFLSGKTCDKALGTLPGLEPPCLQFAEIQRVDEMFALQVALLQTGVAVGHVEKEGRGEAGVFPAGGPDDGAQTEVGLVEVEDVEEVSGLGPSGKGQGL